MGLEREIARCFVSEFEIDDTLSDGLNFTAALGTAFLKAHDELCGAFNKDQKIVALPVDLRNRIKEPVSEVLCFYVSRIMFKYDYSPQETFWQNVRKFDTAVKNKIESENLLEPFFRGDYLTRP